MIRVKRVRCVLFRGLAAAALLCAATCALWVRGYFTSDYFAGAAGGWFCGVSSGVGTLSIDANRLLPNRPWRSGHWNDYPDALHARGLVPGERGISVRFDSIGFSFMATRGVPSRRIMPSFLLTVPNWFLLVMLGSWPFILARIMRWRASRSISAGRCRSWGYDLRATPDRCPECGTVPVTTPYSRKRVITISTTSNRQEPSC